MTQTDKHLHCTTEGDKMTYQPSRGGHAPGDLREAFCEAIDAYEGWGDGTPEPTVELRGQTVPITRVCCGIALIYYLRSCARRWGDLAPYGHAPKRNTYAAAALVLKWLVSRELQLAALSRVRLMSHDV